MSRLLPGVIAMATIVVASNILVQFLFGQWLTWGAFTYPLAFLVTDVMNRIYGAPTARKVVFAQVGHIAPQRLNRTAGGLFQTAHDHEE